MSGDPLKHGTWEARTPEANARMIRLIGIARFSVFYFWTSLIIIGLGAAVLFLWHEPIGEYVMAFAGSVFVGANVLNGWTYKKIHDLLLSDEILVYES